MTPMAAIPPTENSPSTFEVLGVPVAATNLAAMEAQLIAWAEDGTGRVVTVPDVSNIVRAQDDRRLFAIHRGAAMVVPDGTPLVWIGKMRGYQVERTCGPDLLEQVIAGSGRSGLKSYFYGGGEGVAELLSRNLKTRFPDSRVVGASTPPFGLISDSELKVLSDDVRRSGANLLWVGISTPKQEYLMARLVHHLPCTLLGVGAAFDFHAGVIRRAPRWMRRFGLEWLYRLSREPGRLWRRYLIMAPRFVGMVVLRELSSRR